MPPRDRAVWRFAGRALLWLVPSLAAWYALAAAHARPVAWIAEAIVNGYTRGIVTALEWNGRLVTMVTDVRVSTASGEPAVLTPELNPLVYTYGAALFAALALAGRLGAGRLALGLLILLPFHAWGLAFELLVEVGVKAPAGIAASVGIAGLKRELVPLGFQLGSLIFPTLVPVVLWAWLGGLRALMPVAFVETGAPQA